MDKLMYMNSIINSVVWGKYMIFLLLFTGAWLLIRTGFLPFRKCGLIWKKTIGSIRHQKGKEGVTPFQAVSTALAGTLGVGSIVGVATAITMGGPGALFWMCISALLGMMTKYGEVVLAVHFRERQADGSYIGGAMSVLTRGCHMGFLGILFAIFCIFASFGIGNVTPANTIAHTISSYVEVNPYIIGFILAVVIAFIMRGKVKGIMRFNELIIPVISIGYVIACVYLLCLHADKVGAAVSLIMKDAFTVQSGVGGFSGFMISKAMHYGISRGVFSNEAGMGSSPISHAAVQDVNAVEQGFWGIFEVFFDTIVVCTLSGLVILTSSVYGSDIEGVILIVKCFEEGFGSLGGILFSISILSFALPSIVGWYYYASECIRYLFNGKWMLQIYQGFFLCLLIFGSALDLRFVWEVADTLNGLMAIPNLISLVLLYRIVVKLTKEYLREHRS